MLRRIGGLLGSIGRRGGRPCRALIGAGVVGIARARRLLRLRSGRRPAAEEVAAEAAEEAGFLSRRGRGVAGLRLQRGNALGGGLQRVLLHEHGLRQHVGRVGQRSDCVVDEGFRLRVARGRARRADALEQVREHLAFFRSHVVLLVRPTGPRRGIWARIATVPRLGSPVPGRITKITCRGATDGFDFTPWPLSRTASAQ